MGTRRRHTPEQIIRKLREGENRVGQGHGLAEVQAVGNLGADLAPVGGAVRGMKADDAKRLHGKGASPRYWSTWTWPVLAGLDLAPVP